MFKSKGATFGIAAALATAALLLGGLALGTTSGAGTDYNVPGAGFTFNPPDLGGQPGDTANPPASPVENPTIPTTDPTGAPGAGGLGPNALPNAGYGDSQGSPAGAVLVLMTLAGIAALGAGVVTVRGGRRS